MSWPQVPVNNPSSNLLPGYDAAAELSSPEGCCHDFDVRGMEEHW